MECRAGAIWDEGYLAYDFGDHPMSPVRLDLTVRLARELGVLERLQVSPPRAAGTEQLLTVHDAAYLDAVRAASDDPSYQGFGLGTDDDPVFPGMYDASALIAGGSAQAAHLVWGGEVEHAVNIAGGLHHAMRGHAAGFCIFNDAVLAITELLAAGAERVAYVDIDVHHGDGVQAAFYDDPRVLTVSLHQDPRTLFPGTGLPGDVGRGDAEGTAVNVALPPGTTDAGWLRAFDAVVPGAVRAFRPEVLVSQCGCDTHHEDPLANLQLTVDGQRAAIARMHALAHDVAGGKWLAFGGGGYGVLRCVPRTWTHLLAEATGAAVAADAAVPPGWTSYLRGRGVTGALPDRMGEGPLAEVVPWVPGGEGWLDGAIGATRRAVFPLLGLDPDDPRD
ncbi:acetoin utilization protein AcuC [Jatrophihabitans endophyticus]|uniref:Acetoin utilization protein AcuC n=1 Tax=Jatrophihabitans endophyticus TaxID=1206085 RepID=A0A1M5ST04_9ACTN|nr:acetoin utilization protein AcuC [Jatrophihabitans endophyticus]SHH41635.1 acetoin utilization protein AcuC [Jatrophihabitans endophyticus]